MGLTSNNQGKTGKFIGNTVHRHLFCIFKISEIAQNKDRFGQNKGNRTYLSPEKPKNQGVSPSFQTFTATRIRFFSEINKTDCDK